MSDTRPSDDTNRIVDTEHGKETASERPFLVDPPGPDADIRGLVCLDFDGVLNRFSEGRRDRLPQVVANRHSWGIDLNADIIARLDTVIQRPGIWLAWTTTWGPQISLIQPLFNGHLEGGFVAAKRPRGLYVDIGWKEQAVLRLAEQFPEAKLAWIDDEAVPESLRYGSATRKLPHALLIAPDPARGLQIEQITAIEEYFGAIDAETPRIHSTALPKTVEKFASDLTGIGSPCVKATSSPSTTPSGCSGPPSPESSAESAASSPSGSPDPDYNNPTELRIHPGGGLMPIDVIPVQLDPDGLVPEAERRDVLIIATFNGTRLLANFEWREVRRIPAGIPLDETLETWPWAEAGPIQLGHNLLFKFDREPYWYRTSWILAISRLNSNIPKDYGY